MNKIIFIWLVFAVHYGVAQKTAAPLPYGLQMVSNNEQVPFCIPIPVKEYTEKSSGQRAKKVFVNKQNKKYQLVVQGLFRSDSLSIENYFGNTYIVKDEEEGKVIVKKGLVKTTNCFFATGYYNNEYYSSRFTELTWLRKDDVVKLRVTYPVKDSTLWNKRLQQICTFNSVCN